MLPLHWIKPMIPITTMDADEVILPTFVDLQEKTRMTLYGTSDGVFADKSPKGSVDHPIKPLVDLINHHSAVTTLSSCSGRTSLFDPNHKAQQEDDLGEDFQVEPSPFTEASGKGRGGWLVVSHDILDPEEMVKAIFASSRLHPVTSEPWTLKFEPMLLHIAARSIALGQALLKVALACGFRESGLIVTQKRVTVAIRSHSLALSLPLLPQGDLRPSKEYIVALVHDCNRRLQQNWDHLQRLYRAIEADWFRISLQPKIRLLSTLPPLRLWNTAAVAFSNKQTRGHTSIYAFGGYGRGPDLNSTTSRRTNEIYQLLFDREETPCQWQAVVLQQTSASDRCWKDLNVEPLSGLPTPCQAMAAAMVRDWIVLWGGRDSPTKPLDELLLFHPETRKLARFNKSNSNGDTWPEARWGHSLVPLSKDRLVLVGGGTCGTTRTRLPVFDDIYILHYTPNAGFLWERTAGVKLPGGQLHAAVSVLPHSDRLVVAGGLQSELTPTNVLQLFDKSSSKPVNSLLIRQFGESTTIGDDRTTKTETWIVKDSSPSSIPCGFGANLSTLMDGKLLVLTGGASADIGEPVQVFLIQEGMRTNTVKLIELPVSVETTVDFGSLVHHTNVTLSEAKFAVIGGGVTSFAFGDSFASSYMLEVLVSGDMPDHVGNRLQVSAPDGEQSTTISNSVTVSRPNAPTSTPVVYVSPKDAKPVKNLLEQHGWLDKGFRMIPVITDSEQRIAIPILSTAALDASWSDQILEMGVREDMPLSTARFAAHKKAAR